MVFILFFLFGGEGGFRDLFDFLLLKFCLFGLFEILDFWIFFRVFGFKKKEMFFDFFPLFSKLLRLVLKATNVTTEPKNGLKWANTA